MNPKEHTAFDEFCEEIQRTASPEELEEARLWVKAALYPEPCPLCEVGTLSPMLDEEGGYPLVYSVCDSCESEICTGEQLNFNVKYRRKQKEVWNE